MGRKILFVYLNSVFGLILILQAVPAQNDNDTVVDDPKIEKVIVFCA